MKLKRFLCKVLVLVIILVNSTSVTVLSDTTRDSFVLDYGTIENIKRTMHIKEGVFPKEIKEQLSKNIVEIEACEGQVSRAVKSGTGILIGDKGVAVTNRSLLEGWSDFRVSNSLTRVVANISSEADMAVLVSKAYSNKKGLQIRDYKGLQAGEALYSISWQTMDYPIADPGEYIGLKKVGAVEYICMKGAGYFGTAGAVLVDKEGKALGISANVSEDEYTYYIPFSKHENLMKDKHVSFLSDLGVQVEDTFDDMELKFESSSIYDGNKLKVVYNVITNTKNYEAYRERIGDEAFQNKLGDYFEKLIKSKADIYGIKDYDYYLNLRYYILAQEIRNGQSISKEWFKSQKLDTYMQNIINKNGEAAMADSSIVVDKSGKLSKIATITEALTKAAPGSRITIEPGIYNESLLVNKDGIELHGKPGAIIEAEGENTLTVSSDKVKISGIEFRNKSKDRREIIYISKGSPIISDCIINGPAGAGIRIDGDSNPEIEGNIIKNCMDGIIAADNSGIVARHNFITQSKESAIKVNSSGKVIIKYNYLSKSGQYGITADNAKQLTIINNNIDNNQLAGINVKKGYELQAVNNRIFDNGNGIELYEAPKATIKGNILEFNKMNGIHAGQSTAAYISSNYISCNKMSGIYVNDTAQVYIEGNRAAKNNSQGIAVEGSSYAEILSSTIAENGASGITFDFSSRGKIENSTVFANRPKEIVLGNSANIIMKNNKVLYQR